MIVEGITFISGFLQEPQALYEVLERSVDWDERMQSRKTASYGAAYNYSQISYPYRTMLPELEALCTHIETALGFRPNNCLINFYPDGASKMGFHSDQAELLAPHTGVVIISLGDTRTIRFRKIDTPDETIDYSLEPGSMLYMLAEVQEKWQHAIPRSDSGKGRISLTFRKINA